MSDDLREQLAEALAYKPGSSAYDYADRVLPVAWEYGVQLERAERNRWVDALNRSRLPATYRRLVIELAEQEPCECPGEHCGECGCCS